MGIEDSWRKLHPSKVFITRNIWAEYIKYITRMGPWLVDRWCGYGWKSGNRRCARCHHDVSLQSTVRIKNRSINRDEKDFQRFLLKIIITDNDQMSFDFHLLYLYPKLELRHTLYTLNRHLPYSAYSKLYLVAWLLSFASRIHCKLRDCLRDSF